MSGSMIRGDARALGRAFDEAFASAPPSPRPPGERLLAITVGDERYALRLAELEGLHPLPPLTPLPTSAIGLLGICALRGGLVPVYSLRALLGHPPVAEPARWMVLAASPEPLALALERPARALTAERTSVEAVAADPGRPHVVGVVREGGEARAVLSIPSLLDSIRSRIR